MKMKNKYMGGGLNKRSMYEKGGLSKAQKKMDKNNNNEIDSQDLAMLRKAEKGMKMKYEEGGEMTAEAKVPSSKMSPRFYGLSEERIAQIKQRDTDKLSFGEAFDFYRNELGGGERFMWKGKPYSTSTPEELLEREIGGVVENEPMKINIAERIELEEQRERKRREEERRRMEEERKKDMSMRMPPPMPGKI
jgi:hypothetical protein|tara:strand:+ start:353 stop:928 length:576 start_codon:yes stop_codon:yes gene_type:complete